MKPIWFFVGLILIVMGGLIIISGLYQLINPPQYKTVLASTHPDLWWGGIIVLFGGIMYLKNRKQEV